MASADTMTDPAEVDTAVIKDYLIAKMQEWGVLQHDDEQSKRTRMKVLEMIPSRTNKNPAVAMQNPKPVIEAIEEDLNFEITVQKIRRNITTDRGKQMLEQLRDGLSQQDREELQELLVWTIYAKIRPDVEELEAALYLRCDMDFANTVRQKLNRTYEKAFDTIGLRVYPRDAIEMAINLPSDRSLVDLPTGTLKVNKSTPVKALSDDLYDRLLSHLYTNKTNKTKVSTDQASISGSTDKFSANQRFAEITILSRLFKALNNISIHHQVDALIIYAAYYLPYHLQKFVDMIDYASRDELKVVGKGLVNFLREPKIIEAAFVLHQFNSTHWLSEDAIRAIRTVLINISFHDQLEQSEWQWARDNTDEDSGKAPFLANVAFAAARCWLTDDAHLIFDPALNAKPRSDPMQVDHPRPKTFENELSASTDVRKSEQNVTKTFNINPPVEPESEAKMTRIQRIQRAERWALETLKIDLNSCALERIGFALLGFNETKTAIEYLERAAPISKSPYSAIGLARAYEFKAEDSEPAEAREQYGRAIEWIQNALAMFRAESQIVDEDEYPERDDHEVHDLFTCLLRTAGYHESIGEHAAAIDLLGEALKCRPHSSDCRWHFIELLSRDGHHAQAQSVFEDWNSISSTPDIESPSNFFDRWLTSYAELHRGFLPTMLTMSDTKLDHSIREAIEKAIKDAKELKKGKKVVWLQYALGLIYAANGGVGNLAIAERYWLDALQAGRETELSDDTPVQWSSNLLSMLYFEDARKDLHERTPEASIALLDRLTSKVSQVLSPNYGDLPETQRPTAYVAALGNLLSEPEYSKKFLTQDMTTAIQILFDDDNADFGVGAQTLFGVLLCYGDYEGALTAWSLFDRAETRLRARQKTEVRLQNASLRNISRNTPAKLETEASKGETTDFLESQRLVDQEGQKDGNERQYDFLVAVCDNCSEYIYSRGENSEIWWCKYCPFIKFCTPCKVERGKGKFVNYRCNPEHPLLLAKHYEYSEEELRADNVRIEWKFETVEADGEGHGVRRRIMEKERVGGRVVDLKEWLRILRQEWAIPETNMEEIS